MRGDFSPARELLLVYSAVPARKEGCCSAAVTLTVLGTGWGGREVSVRAPALDALLSRKQAWVRGPCDSPDPHQGCTARVELPWERGQVNGTWADTR